LCTDVKSKNHGERRGEDQPDHGGKQDTSCWIHGRNGIGPLKRKRRTEKLNKGSQERKKYEVNNAAIRKKTWERGLEG